MRLEVRQISKWFGSQAALRDVSFDVQPGEVHVLAGENGAGKSTLVNILSGALSPDGGEIRIDDRPACLARPLDAVSAGIATIHQELPLVGPMSIADNLFLGRERSGRWGVVRFAEQREEAARLLAEVGLPLDPATPIERLSVAQRQLVELARALGSRAEMVLMDEPTSALDDTEAALLAARVEQLTTQGKAVVLVTHRLDEIYRLAHRVTVLRDGERVGTARVDDLPRDQLITWMAGRLRRAERGGTHVLRGGCGGGGAPLTEKLEQAGARARKDPGPIALRVTQLGLPAALEGVDLHASRGEVVGIAGLRGSGASDLLHALFGSHPRNPTGHVEVDGAPYATRTPRESVARGLVLLAGDRQAALVPDLGVIANATLAGLDRFVHGPLLDRAAERRATEEMATRFRLRAPSLDAPVRVLSGGNQQKVLIARCALAAPKVLLLDEPTRGVDIAARADIYRAIRLWADAGVAILLLTSDTEELVALSDRIVVLYRGRVAQSFDHGATREQVVAAAVGGDA